MKFPTIEEIETFTQEYADTNQGFLILNRLQWQIVIVSIVIIFLLAVSQSPDIRHKIRKFIGDDSIHVLPPND